MAAKGIRDHLGSISKKNSPPLACSFRPGVVKSANHRLTITRKNHGESIPYYILNVFVCCCLQTRLNIAKFHVISLFSLDSLGGRLSIVHHPRNLGKSSPSSLPYDSSTKRSMPWSKEFWRQWRPRKQVVVDPGFRDCAGFFPIVYDET